MKRSLFFLATALSLSAQIEGPRLGLLVDGTQLHTAWGVPGVAVTTPLRDVAAKSVAASPRQDYLLAVPADGPGLLVLSPTGLAETDRLVLADGGTIDAVVFSSRGTAVAVRRSSRVDVVTGLPQRADVVQTFDLSFAGSDTARVAVSDDGGTLFALVGADAYRMNANGMTRLSVEGVLAGEFLPRSGDLVLASQDKITILRDAQAATEFAAPGTSAKSLYTTSRFAVIYDRDFVVVDLVSGQTTRLSPDNDARSVQPAGEVLFYRTGDGWSAVDLSAVEPRLTKVPKRFVPETTDSGVAQ